MCEDDKPYTPNEYTVHIPWKGRRKINMGIPERDPLLVEREKTHGSFKEQGRYAQKLKEMFSEKENYAAMRGDQREALDMIATKISRLLHGDCKNADSWNDIAGYAKLGSEACDG